MAIVALKPDGSIRLLSAILWELPALPRAACRGHWPDFDDWLPGKTREVRVERLDAAVAVCHRCPDLRVCELLPLAQGGGVGVMAGRMLAS